MPPRKSNGRKPKAKPRAAWVWAPATIKPGGAIREEVETRARELIDTLFKPYSIKPPPKDERFNYQIDIISRWHRGFFYFVSIYASPGPNALSPTFEAPFTRLRHLAGDRFDLGYFRHTGQWWEVYHGLTLEKAFQTIRDETLFWPLP